MSLHPGRAGAGWWLARAAPISGVVASADLNEFARRGLGLAPGVRAPARDATAASESACGASPRSDPSESVRGNVAEAANHASPASDRATGPHAAGERLASAQTSRAGVAPPPTGAAGTFLRDERRAKNGEEKLCSEELLVQATDSSQ
jgi:hypothetical protein